MNLWWVGEVGGGRGWVGGGGGVKNLLRGTYYGDFLVVGN